MTTMKSFIRPGQMADYDMFQPCFFEDEDEEFYHTPATMPSDDIWKKFELLPTPPLSPSRDTATETPSDLDLGLDLEEHLPFDVAELLNDDNLVAKVLPSFPEAPPIPISVNLQSKLIQDCMWSGLTGITSDITKSDKNSGFDMKSSDCVDPAAVFPYPIADTHCHSLGTETPSDSEEEIDVVTVEKQLKQQQIKKQALQVPTATTLLPCKQRTTSIIIKKEIEDCTTVEVTTTVPTYSTVPIIKTECPTEIHNYSLPHSHSLKRGRSVPSSPFHSNCSTPTKRKRDLGVSELKRVAHKLRHTQSSSSSSCSSRNSSDSEDCCEGGGKRTQHNVLERKRRNDLKYSFFSLRDSVPELLSQERAPKVLILRKASDYVRKLAEDSRKIQKDLDSQKARNEQLKRTLAKLRNL